MSDETITIRRAHYDSLLDSHRKLNALYAAGVDNWEGYSEACGESDDDEEEGDVTPYDILEGRDG